MKLTSTFLATIVVLFLSACGAPIPPLEPTSTPAVLSDCFISFKLAAWQDVDGNGQWDASEPPLEGVTYQLQGIFAEQWEPIPDPSLGVGWFSLAIWSPGNCIQQDYTITAVPPPSYEATIPTVVIFSGPPPYRAQFGFRPAFQSP